MYPIALEKQYQTLFTREFDNLALPYTKEIIKKLGNEIKADSSDAVRADSITQMLIFIAELKEKYGKRIDSEILAGKIEKNFRLIDAWSRDKTTDAIGKLYTRMNTPQPSSVTGRPAPKGRSGELWMPTINLRKNLHDGLIDDVVKKNVNLINKAYRDHFDDIGKIVKDGIQSGIGGRAIADELRKQTGVNQSKAKFWARDQASKFFGETTRLRQKEAGIPGYVWRCVGGARTRDTHLALEGTYHDWNTPPVIDGRPCHPGDDFNCRCWPEPALGPEAAEREYKEPLEHVKTTSEKDISSGSALVYINQKSIADVNKYATGFLADTASFKGVQSKFIDRVNEWNYSLTDVINDFPAIRLQMRFTGTCQQHYAFAAANRFKTGKVSPRAFAFSISDSKIQGISINKNWINNPDFIKVLKSEVQSNFHPIGCDTIKSLVDHEAAHILDDVLKLDRDSVITYIWDGYIDKSRITEDLSKYAWFNTSKNPIKEFIAEAFAEYRNNPNCRPLAKRIGERIEYLYKTYEAGK